MRIGYCSRIFAFVVMAAGACTAPNVLVAQQCPCSVRVDTLAIIGGDHTDTGNLVGAYDPARRLLYTTNRAWQDRILVYEVPEGARRQVMRPVAEIGRRGDGPGEFRRVIALTLLGDTLAAYDAQHERVSLFGPDNRFIRSFPTPGRGRLNVLSTLQGHLVGEFVDPMRPGDPALKVLVPATGQVIRTLDVPQPMRSIGYAISIAGARKIATDSAGTVFAAWRGAYEIVVHPRQGETVTIKGEHPSFVGRSYLAEMGVRNQPQRESDLSQRPFEAVQEAIWVDPGTGWVASLLLIPTGRPRSEPGSFTRRIEFWDTNTRHVRVSLTDVPPIDAHAGGGVVLGGEHDRAGNPLLLLLRIRVVSQTGGGR